MGKALAFIISQFHADSAQQQEFNKDFAKALAREIYCDGYVPVVPHLYFPRFLADEGQKRQWGIMAGHRMMALCSRVFVATIDGHVSDGMRQDIDFAASLKIPNTRMEFSAEGAAEYIKRFKESRA